MRTPSPRALLTAALTAVLITAGALVGGDYVQPQTLDGATLTRAATAISYTTNTQYTGGAPLFFTNLLLLAEGGATQGLSEVTVELAASASSTSTGVWTEVSVQSTNGLVYGSLDLPTSTGSSIYWQARITDADTNVYYYIKNLLYVGGHL